MIGIAQHTFKPKGTPIACEQPLVRANAQLPRSLSVSPNCQCPVFLLTSRLFQERPLLKFRECLPQLLLCVHHDGTVPGDGFFERLS